MIQQRATKTTRKVNARNTVRDEERKPDGKREIDAKLLFKSHLSFEDFENFSSLLTFTFHLGCLLVI